jgi:hypothetical protein
MDRKRRWTAGLAVVGALVLYGALGSVVFGAQGSGSSTTPAAPAGATLRFNEDPAHEQGESAAREAAEDSGQVAPGGRHHGPCKKGEGSAPDAGGAEQTPAAPSGTNPDV